MGRALVLAARRSVRLELVVSVSIWPIQGTEVHIACLGLGGAALGRQCDVNLLEALERQLLQQLAHPSMSHVPLAAPLGAAACRTPHVVVPGLLATATELRTSL